MRSVRTAAELRALKPFIRLYPLTLVGTFLLVLSLYLLGRSFAIRNPYGFFIATAAFSVLILLSVIGWLQARGFREKEAGWDSSVPLYANEEGMRHTLLLEKLRSLPFFRIHFILSGKILVGHRAYLYPFREIATKGGETVPFTLHLPLCGAFHARGRFEVRDVFGLTRMRFGLEEERHIVVRPALLKERNFPNIEAMDGLENKSKIKSSDVERYFMREYIPGDKIRDINWKASSRFSELFTRISPVTQEKTRVISVFFRPFWHRKAESVYSLVHLNYIKSWLLLFLKAVKQAHPEYQFHVGIGDQSFVLETEMEIDAFAVELSGLLFRIPPSDYAMSAQMPGEAFVFTTPYDTTLSTFLNQFQNARIYTFRTAAPTAKNIEKLKKIRLFRLHSSVYFAGPWILNWDRQLKNPAVRLESMSWLHEEPLEVRFA
ncbi:MAG TPA: DUF58 domain-containing protein [Spirochaetia bacterium]|nr:DUF58 domain-containing protein [Spirochaetia bacterium]